MSSTRALFDDLPLQRPDSRVLLAVVERGEIELVVPEVVILEAARHFRERLEEGLRGLVKARRVFEALAVPSTATDPPPVDAQVAGYEASLRVPVLGVHAARP